MTVLLSIYNKKASEMFMKSKLFLIIGLVMFFLMLAFLFYAANNPQGHFPWSFSVTHTIYRIYIILMIGSFLVSAVLKVIKNIRK